MVIKENNDIKGCSMKYKTYGSIEKCFNILVNEKGYSKEEAQDIIDRILADYKYNPNSTDSLLRRINLVLPKDEYEKEYGIKRESTKRLKEKETPNIEVKHEGILEVPEGKNVDDLPLSHFVDLANKKGLSKITKALNNLQVWNKNDDKKLSRWAGNMIDKLNKKLGKNESAMKIRINESEMPYVLWVLDGNDNTWKMYKGINNAKTFINNNDYDEFLNALNIQVYPNKTYKNNYIDWIVIPAGEDPKTFNVDSFYGKIEKESLTKEPNKSYWKFNQFEKDDYDDYKYYDKYSIRKFNLIPCENEDDCFVDENDNYSAWPVYDMADGDSTKPVYCTKREAYNYLLDLLNQSTYEQEYDL